MKILECAREKTGQTKEGDVWRTRSYYGVYDWSNPIYPKSIAVEVKGENIDRFNLTKGEVYDMDIDFSARKWNDKYYLTAVCWRAAKAVRT